MKQNKTNKIPTFLSYAHTDEPYKNNFMQHLTGLMETKLELWQDRLLVAGKDWEETIKQQLTQSQLILFLISPAFRSSAYITEVELALAFQQKKAKGTVEIIPIMLRPTDIENSSLEKLQFLPKNAKPVTTWDNEDLAWLEVVNGIKKVLPELTAITAQLPQNTTTPQPIERLKDLIQRPYPEWREFTEIMDGYIQQIDQGKISISQTGVWVLENLEDLTESLVKVVDREVLHSLKIDETTYCQLVMGNIGAIAIDLEHNLAVNFEAIVNSFQENGLKITRLHKQLYIQLLDDFLIELKRQEMEVGLPLVAVFQPVIREVQHKYSRLR